MGEGCSSFVGASVGGEGGAVVGEGGKAVDVGSSVGVNVGSGVGVSVVLAAGIAVPVGNDRMNTAPAPSSGLSPEQAARKRTAAVNATMARTRRIAISRRFYRKGGRGASLL